MLGAKYVLFDALDPRGWFLLTSPLARPAWPKSSDIPASVGQLRGSESV